KEYRDRLHRSMQGTAESEGQASPGTPWAHLWPAGKWTSDHDEALEFHVMPHRSQSVVLEVATGPKTVEEINSRIPPCDLDWTRVIIGGVVERGWIQRAQGTGARFELTERGIRILRALEQIPEETKASAWKEIWG